LYEDGSDIDFESNNGGDFRENSYESDSDPETIKARLEKMSDETLDGIFTLAYFTEEEEVERVHKYLDYNDD
jgi:hypothetical protein